MGMFLLGVGATIASEVLITLTVAFLVSRSGISKKCIGCTYYCGSNSVCSLDGNYISNPMKNECERFS